MLVHASGNTDSEGVPSARLLCAQDTRPAERGPSSCYADLDDDTLHLLKASSAYIMFLLDLCVIYIFP